MKAYQIYMEILHRYFHNELVQYDNHIHTITIIFLSWFECCEKQLKINLWFNFIFALKQAISTFSQDCKGVVSIIFALAYQIPCPGLKWTASAPLSESFEFQQHFVLHIMISLKLRQEIFSFYDDQLLYYIIYNDCAQNVFLN